MKYNDKILVQAVACLAIFALIRGSAMIGGERIDKVKEEIAKQAQRDYSLEEIREAGSDLLMKAADAPASINTALTNASEAGKFSEPIDKTSDDKTSAVHATSGGEVIYSGIDRELGVCVKIKHDEKTSIYGNLHTLTVVTGEKVRKGDIIGTFDNTGEKDFYYHLE